MNNKFYLVALALVCLAIFIPHLGLIEVDIMEARNFITAREMLDYGNWIHTTMNLEPRYEKPPLPTWMTALSASVFGVNNLFGLRLPAVLAVLFLTFSFYFLGTRVLSDKKQAFIASLILASSFYIIFAGRKGQWDIFAHSFMVFAILQLFKAFEADRKLWGTWMLAGLFLGLSFMSKGPVSLFALLLPFLISYGIVFKFRQFKPKVVPLLGSLLIFAVVGLTWGAIIFLTDSSSAETIADKETQAWANRSVKPFYHYWSFFVQSGIWAYFSLLALIYPFMIKRTDHKKTYRFSLFWTLSAVVLLSFIPEKKERYLLPVLIPMALNTSFYIYYLIKRAHQLAKTDLYLANFGFGLIGMIGLVFPFGVYFFFEGSIYPHWTSFFLSSVSLFTLGVLLFLGLRKKAYEKCFYCMILFICSIMMFALPMAELLYDNEHYQSPSGLRSIKGMQQLELYSTKRTIPSPELIFDLGEPVKRVREAAQLPQNGEFGLLVSDSIPTEVQNNFTMELVTVFDINNLKEGSRGHKKRKTWELYRLEKKQ